MMLPDPVHHHARGQWIVCARHPVCDVQTSASGGNSRLLLTRDHLQETPRHFVAKILVVAANVQPRIVAVPVFRHHGELGFGDLRFEFRDLRHRRAAEISSLETGVGSLFGRRLRQRGKYDLIDDDVPVARSVHDFEVARAFTFEGQIQSLPFHRSAIGNNVLAFVTIGDDREAKRPALFQRRIALCAADSNVEVELFARPELRRCQSSREHI